jgi:hypothetical protein
LARKARFVEADEQKMKTESKLARQKKAARKVAEILYASLQKFSEEEQERRMKEVHKIAMRASSNRRGKRRSVARVEVKPRTLPKPKHAAPGSSTGQGRMG